MSVFFSFQIFSSFNSGIVPEQCCWFTHLLSGDWWFISGLGGGGVTPQSPTPGTARHGALLCYQFKENTGMKILSLGVSVTF